MKNKKLEKIRKKLDILDSSFLNILKKRTKLVDQVLKIKKYKKDIIDRKRIKVILKNIKIKSRKKKLDPKISYRIWKSMIQAYIDYEFRKFKNK